MAREMYLVGVDPEELKPSSTPPEKPKNNWENIWYHYKWWIIGGLFFAVVLAIILGDILPKNDPDYRLLLVTDRPYLAQTVTHMEDFLEQYGQDLDGDGQVEVSITTCHLGAADTIDEQTANYQTLQVHLATGDMMFFAFEEEYYKWFMSTMEEKNYRFLTPLDFSAPGVREDGCSWTWKDDKRRLQDVILSELPEDLCFGVRAATGTAQKKGEVQQQCLDLLEAVATGNNS